MKKIWNNSIVRISFISMLLITTLLIECELSAEMVNAPLLTNDNIYDKCYYHINEYKFKEVKIYKGSTIEGSYTYRPIEITSNNTKYITYGLKEYASNGYGGRYGTYNTVAIEGIVVQRVINKKVSEEFQNWLTENNITDANVLPYGIGIIADNR